MAEEILATLVAVLASAVLAIAGVAGAYLLRRIHELADRMTAVELKVDRLLLIEADALQRGRQQGARRQRAGGRRNAD